MANRTSERLFPRKSLKFASLLVLASLPGLALAGGLSLYEIGTDDVGLAAAGYGARAQDASTILTNPAGMTRLEGTQVLAGLQALYGDIQFTLDGRTSPELGTGDGGKPIGLLPGGSTFVVFSASDRIKLGLGVAGNFGLTEEFDSDWAGRYYGQKSTLLGISVLPTVAFRLNDKLSLGLGVNAMYTMLDAEVAINNLRGPDGQLSVEDKVWGWGGTIGLMLEPSDTSRIGITYSSRINLDFSAPAEFSGLASGLETVLGRRGLLNADVDLGMQVPQGVMVSFYSKTGAKAALLGSFGWQEWTKFGKVDIGLDSNDPQSLTTETAFSNTWHAAMGMQLELSEPWLLNFGVGYDSSFQDSSSISPMLPAGTAWRFGLGARHRGSKSMSWGVAAEYVYGGNLHVEKQSPLPVALGGRGDLAGSYNDTAMIFLAGNLNWKF